MSFYEQPFEDIKVIADGNLLWITLNRANFSNAISTPMIENLCKVLKHADFDNQIRVILLTGEGKTFCAGGDIKDMKQKSGMFSGDSNELRENYMKGIQQIPLTIEAMQTPIIALINGPAIGAGLDLALMCDIRIAVSSAKFGETFCKLGLVPGDGGTYFLSRIVGYAKAMELSLTGEIINAQTAKEIGILNNIVDSDLINKGKELAIKISANSPIAISMIKKALKDAYHNHLSNHLDLLAAYQGITQRSHDHHEALKKLI